MNLDERQEGARRGRPQLVTMFYTSCQMVCPLIIDSLRLTRNALDPAVRIVMLTANIQESSRNEAASMRVHFVAKPATEASLQQALNHLIGA